MQIGKSAPSRIIMGGKFSCVSILSLEEDSRMLIDRLYRLNPLAIHWFDESGYAFSMLVVMAVVTTFALMSKGHPQLKISNFQDEKEDSSTESEDRVSNPLFYGSFAIIYVLFCIVFPVMISQDPTHNSFTKMFLLVLVIFLASSFSYPKFTQKFEKAPSRRLLFAKRVVLFHLLAGAILLVLAVTFVMIGGLQRV
ncbi:MAG: hypothetical protein ACON5G_02615 [Pirellulaceae bacterium]